MTTTLATSPFLWVEFDKHGALVDPAAFEKLDAAISAVAATDVVFISHGWKNDSVAALKIYKPLWDNTRAALTKLDPARIVVAGVLWPSVPNRTNFDEAALLEAANQVAVSVEDGQGVEDIDAETLEQAIDDFLGGDPDPFFRAKALAASKNLASDEAVEFLDAAMERVVSSEKDSELSADIGPIAERIAADPKGVLGGLSARPNIKVEPSVGGALGIGDDIKKFFAGKKAAIARLLNQLSFYDMKERAGMIGAKLGVLLAGRANAADVRLHLVGHSFGARLVTSAANALVHTGAKLDSLTLLEGAFSHNSLSADFEGKPAAFADVAKGGVRTIAITHTHNDRACTLAYAAASRLSRQTASAVGDKNDRFGAMGANGAQNVPAIQHTAIPGTPGSEPTVGAINNYLADEYIIGNPRGTDAHGDVHNPTVAKLLASVLEA